MLIDFDLKACVCVCGAELGWLFGVSCVFSFPSMDTIYVLITGIHPAGVHTHTTHTRAGGGVVVVLMNYNVV